MHHQNKKLKQQKKKETAKHESNLGFIKGDVRKVCLKNKQTLGKEKAIKKNKWIQINSVFQKGVDGQITKKKLWNFEREDKREKKKQNRKKKGFGGTKCVVH